MIESGALFELLSTGIPKLDELLGGGIPSESMTILTGAPGTGKTVFALQMLFAAAGAGKKCLYLTTLSEPAIKVLRYMQRFSFFDERLVDEQLVLRDLGAILQGGGPRAALDELTQLVERVEPALVVVDSFKAIHEVIADPIEGRVAIHNAAIQWAAWGATTFLIGEYTQHEIGTMPEFAIADGIIEFVAEHENLTALRQLEVHKLRGAAYAPGRHFLDITKDGLRVFPRVAAGLERGWPAVEGGRISSGVAGLDALFGGGPVRGTATLVEGGSGTGKTLLGLHFAIEGARKGEPVLWVSLEESAAQLRATAGGFGWKLADLEAHGTLRILELSRIELSPDRMLSEVADLMREMRAQRLVFDSLTAAAAGMTSMQRFQNTIVALVKHLQIAGVSMLLTAESVSLLGSSELSGLGLASVADTLLLFRYLEIGGHLERAASLLKARGIQHTTELHELTISGSGLEVGPPLTRLLGALTNVRTAGNGEPPADTPVIARDG
ncbi:MAG: AAA family ATPase [Chloroflexi bacterium]|nr:AAA family ATPase [Chloroflexota bacterium]